MADQPFLSLSMIVKNEEADLDACLRSAKALCDELVVVDTGSTDQTVEIAKRHGARVFHFDWCDDFAAARNFALDRTRGAWVLHLDADEVALEAAPGALRAELAAQPEEVRFLRVVVRSLVPNRAGRDEHQARRLFRRQPAVRWRRRIHENITALEGEQPRQEAASRAMVVDHFGYQDPEQRKQRGKNDRNVRLLVREILDNPDDVVPHFYLAREHASGGDNARALQVCRDLLSRLAGRLAPAFEDAIRAQGMRSASALRDWALAVELGRPRAAGGETSEFAFLLGRAYLQVGDFENAETQLRRALSFGQRIGPYQSMEGTGTWRPLAELGELAWRREQRDEALEQWRAAAAAAPGHAGVQLVLGRGLLALDRPAEAVEALERALALDPELHEAELRLAEASLRLGDGQAAYDRLEALVRAHPEAADHWHWLGSLLSRVGEFQAAVDVLGLAIERHQDHAALYLTLGAALEKLGRHEDALNAFALAAALDPASEVARAGIAVAAYGRIQQENPTALA
jgi:glycosyltransferase involved in cell wall biosynthesis